MGQYKSQYTGPQIDAGVGAALNPDLVPTDDSDALITSDAVAKVQQGFAPIETAATSANSYAIGDLLVWGGVLYKAKTSITAGDSFVVDTNIEATTIADKLNNIDTEITSNTDTTLTGVLTGNGSKVGTKSLDTSSLTNDADHVPVSSVVKSALTQVETDLVSVHATGATNATGATIKKYTYFYLNEVLVQATADIASDATFTSGTNYSVVTAGALNDLTSVVDNTDSFSSGVSGTKYISKKAGVVSINFQNVQGLSAHDAVVMTLSAGFRPRNNLTFTGVLRKGSGWASATFYPVSIYIQTTGTIQIAGNTTEISNGNLYAAATFFAG